MSAEARPRVHAAPGPLAAARVRRRAPSLPSPPPPLLAAPRTPELALQSRPLARAQAPHG